MPDPLQRDGPPQEPALAQGRVSDRLRLGAHLKLRIHRHDLVDSTNERAFAALAAGQAEHGDVHIASAQSQGRGRLGRSWESAPGQGLYLSLILRPGPPPLSPVALTMLTGLAVARSARELGVPAAHLDWPNDVVVKGAKLAGILVESRGLAATDPVYVIGIGLNVEQLEFSPALLEERAVTSLALEGSSAGIERATELVLAELGRRLEGARDRLGELGEEYLRATGLRGRRVRVQVGSETHVGELTDLSLRAGLLLTGADGAESRHALEHVRSLEALDPT